MSEKKADKEAKKAAKQAEKDAKRVSCPLSLHTRTLLGTGKVWEV
jgi:hypothetical protein